MNEGAAFGAAVRRVLELMEGIRALVRQEREYAESGESFPEGREARFLEKNRAMEQAMRDVTARFHEVSKHGGEREKSEALRVVENLRETFRETMRLVQETQSAVQRVRDETSGEIRSMGQRENALRAYGANRGTYNIGGKSYENPGTAAR